MNDADDFAGHPGNPTSAESAIELDVLERLLDTHLTQGHTELLGRALLKGRELPGPVFHHWRAHHDRPVALDNDLGTIGADAVANADQGETAPDVLGSRGIPVN